MHIHILLKANLMGVSRLHGYTCTTFVLGTQKKRSVLRNGDSHEFPCGYLEANQDPLQTEVLLCMTDISLALTRMFL